ncbi:LysR family transcriptional regulator [Rouxiella sp. Mn2063]|uniref:LysR family transcriptional regulator n=1 Tax=Rouxiella sp. Mn2063 TaxID=3395262 RepID=UPI003BDBD7CF
MAKKDLEIQWLRTFISVVHSGSMTASSRHLSRSQSAISMHIKNIEEVLGTTVFNRETKSIQLTPAGHELMKYADSILKIHAQAIHHVSGNEQRGKISLGIPDDYASYYLPSILRSFTQRYPQVEISLLCEPSSQLLPKIDSGELDVAIITRDSPSRGIFLTSEPLVWAGTMAAIRLEHAPLPVAMYEFGSEARKKITHILDALPGGYRVMYNSPYIAGQIAVAESGLAVSVLTRCCAPAHLIMSPHNALPDLPVLDIAVVSSERQKENIIATLLIEEIITTFKTLK